VVADIVDKKALVNHYDDFLEVEEFGLGTNELARQLQALEYPAGTFAPAVDYFEITSFTPPANKRNGDQA